MRARRPADRDLPGHGLDALIGIDPGGEIGGDQMAGNAVGAGELPQQRDDRLVGFDLAGIEHIAQGRGQRRFLEGEHRGAKRRELRRLSRGRGWCVLCKY